MENSSSKEETLGYPAEVISLLNSPQFFGRMNDPTASSN